MTPEEKTMLDFSGFCYIHKPDLAEEINTLIAKYINTLEPPKKQT